MRLVTYAVAATAIGSGAYVYGHGHDYDGIVAKPPAQVYAAFSGQVGDTLTDTEDGLAEGRLSREVTRVYGKSLKVVYRQANRPLLTIDFHFAPANGGAATRLTADLDADMVSIHRQLGDAGGPYVPNRLLSAGFARFVDKEARQIEAGQELASLAPDDMGVPMRSPHTLSEGRWEAEMAQREAAAPTASAEPMANAAPMVDANPDHRYDDGH